jgi:Domain of unknown function (DUF4326)
MTAISLSSVVLDMEIYPRAEWSQPTVERYVEALEARDRFPPIILESATSRLLDGMHRYQAHRRLGRDEIDAEHHEIPDGVPPLLYAASLSARHGDRISGKDLQAIVRKVVTENPDFSMVTAAKYCGVTRQTVSKWSGDITERRKTVRKVRVALLTRTGLSNREVGRFLGIDESTVRENVKDDISPHLTEDILRASLDELPEECQRIAEEIREERIFASWSDRERELLKQLRSGETVIVSMRDTAHPNLVRWAEDADLFVRIDRRTDWGNPFEMPGDGDRETVIRNYAEHYLPHKPSLLKRLEELRGKALGCWCAPEPCHGDILDAFARGEGFTPGDPIQESLL